MTSPRFIHLARTFAAAFQAVAEHAKAHPHEADRLYESVAGHLRSAAPMTLLGVSDVVEPTAEATISLGDGARVEVRMLDGKLNLYVADALQHDADVGLTASQAEQLRRDLARVLAAGKEAA
jgi:hypothetical protein